MNKHIRTCVLYGFVAVSLIGWCASNAFAYAYVATCNGDPVQWRETINVHRNSFSIAGSGDVNTAYHNGSGQWRAPMSTVSMSLFVNPTSDTSWDAANNGQNEVSRVSGDQIDNDNGWTWTEDGMCFVGENDIEEIDILVNADLTFTKIVGNDVSNPNWGRQVFVHEFGHALGLADWGSNHSAMRGVAPVAAGGEGSQGEPARIWPDDAIGISSMYGGGVGENYQASSQTRAGVLLETGTISRCRGQTVTVRFYVGNNGLAGSVNYGARIRLNTSPPNFGVNASGAVVGTYTLLNAPRSESIRTFTFTIPNNLILQPTPQNIFLDLDPTNARSELKEDDNRTVSGMQVIVNC